jgi:hypothetical protein
MRIVIPAVVALRLSAQKTLLSVLGIKDEPRR